MVTSISRILGCLTVLDEDGNLTARSRRISTRHDLVIGRDANRCQWVFQDPHMSQQHLRIYIVMPPEGRPELEPFVYAEDISRNGVYWNGSLIGNKSNAFLLSDGDRLRLTSKTSLKFEASSICDTEYFSIVQEREMRAFCTEYIVTDRLVDASPFSRKFMAIEQRSRTQVTCEIIKLDQPTRNYRDHSSNKRPRPTENLEFQHELQMVKSWVNDKVSKIPNEERLEKCFRISKLLHSINHPNLLSLEKILVTDNDIYIFQELIPAGNLLAYVGSKNGRLLELEVAIITRQILVAVQALHKEHVVHRNVRPTTILVSSSCTLPRFILSGFELARMIIPKRESYSGSSTRDVSVSRYFPETKVHAGGEDLRCIGAMAAFLLTGSDRLYNGSRVLRAAGESGHYFDVLPTLPRFQSLRSEAIDFINQLTNAARQETPRAQEALNHVWFSNTTQSGDVQQLCDEAVRYWKPALLKDPFIDFVKGVSHDVQGYACSQRVIEKGRPIRGRSVKKPVEAPYRPFYRQVYHMANAGDRAARTPHRTLRKINVDWKRGMSSSPSPTRTSSSSSPSTSRDGPRHELKAHNANQEDQSTFPFRPKLTRQYSFLLQNPEIASTNSRASHSTCHRGSAVEPANEELLPTSSRCSKRGEATLLGTAVAIGKPTPETPNHSEERKLNTTSGLHMRSRPRSPSSTWALNVRSESKLNARISSRSSNSVASPKLRDGRSIFDLEVKSQQPIPASTPVTYNKSHREVLGGSGVTPHMAHLRLA